MNATTPLEPAVVAVASDAVEAAIWVDALRDAGIQAATYERGVGAALGGAVAPGLSRYPVLVPRESLVPARNVITDLAGAAVLAPLVDPLAASSARSRALRTVGAMVAVVALAALLARLLS